MNNAEFTRLRNRTRLKLDAISCHRNILDEELHQCLDACSRIQDDTPIEDYPRDYVVELIRLVVSRRNAKYGDKPDTLPWTLLNDLPQLDEHDGYTPRILGAVMNMNPVIPDLCTVHDINRAMWFREPDFQRWVQHHATTTECEATGNTVVTSRVHITSPGVLTGRDLQSPHIPTYVRIELYRVFQHISFQRNRQGAPTNFIDIHIHARFDT